MRLNRGTIFLLVILLVIIAGASFLLNNNSGSQNTPTTTQTLVNLFEGVTVEQVTSLSVSSVLDPARVPEEALQPEATAEPDAEATEEPASVAVTMAVALDDAGIWTTTEETDITSDRALLQDNIRSTINTVIGMRSSDQFEPQDGNLTPFGLDNPIHEIRFTVAAEEEGAEATAYRVRLGGKNPAGTNYYALFGDNDTTVYVISNASGLDNNVLDLVTDPPFEVDPTPTPAPILNVPGQIFTTLVGTDMMTYTVTDNRDGRQFTLVRGDQNIWYEENAAEDAPEIDQMEAFFVLNGFLSLQGLDGITTDNLEPLGLADPAYTITVETASEQVFTVRLGNQDPTGARTYALVNDFPTVVILNTAAAASLVEVLDNPPYVVVEVTPEATAEVTPELTPEATESSE